MNHTKDDGSPYLIRDNSIHYFKTTPSTLFDIPFLNTDKRAWQILNPIPELKETTFSDSISSVDCLDDRCN